MCVCVSVRWRALWEAALGSEMRGRQAFLSFPEPSSRPLSVRSLILCSVEGLLPLFLPLSPSDCEAVHSHCTFVRAHTHKHAKSHTDAIRARWLLILVHLESPVHHLLAFSRDPFQPHIPPPSSCFFCHFIGLRKVLENAHKHTCVSTYDFVILFLSP